MAASSRVTWFDDIIEDGDFHVKASDELSQATKSTGASFSMK
jgi:hypothetical protein